MEHVPGSCITGEESNIRRHIINVFKEGELPKDNNVHFLHVNGVKKLVPFYTLDVISEDESGLLGGENQKE